ncbi:MAG TPA: CBS domain-containing protein [Nitrospirota bacterium]|jgi:predicted transcriptional regulator|nr:CBS domain-containing protein [Nitrospirota bacterium]
MAICAWHIMKENISVGPDTPALEVSNRITSSGLPGLPVVSDTQELLGMVNELHILEAIQKDIGLETITASHLMMKPPLVADANTAPEELIGMQLANRCCAVIPIVRNGKYVGLVSRHMLMDVFTSPHYARFVQKDRKGPFVCL